MKLTNKQSTILHGIMIYTLYLAIVSSLYLSSGCGLLHKNSGVLGNQSKQEQKATVKLQATEKMNQETDKQTLQLIGQYSYGIGYSLINPSTNTLDVVSSINNRIETLSTPPTIEQKKQMEGIVNDLTTNNVLTLNSKDKDIEKLQHQKEQLTKEREEALTTIQTLSQKNAGLADQYKATLNDMDSFLGLGAIWYGLKKMVTRLVWVIFGFGIFFIVLRLAASSNPIAASLFSVFESIISWGISTLRYIAPKAIHTSGLVATDIHQAYVSTLSKVVNGIETIKVKEKASGIPSTISDLKQELSIQMDTTDKQLINNLKN